MVSNNFFLKKKIYISDLFPREKFKKIIKLNNIRSLGEATKLDLTFYDSKKYKSLANQTKARYCITTENLSKDLPKSIEKILVKKVLVELARVSKIMYPFSDLDYPDFSLKKPAKSKFKTVKFGNNVLIGKNVKIGKNPNPFCPILQLSCITTLLLISEFLIITAEPIIQFSPI